MPREADPTRVIREAAEALPDVTSGTSCNQTAYKVKKKAFLYVGPGPKGIGFKAMFKLGVSMDEAKALARDDPDRVEVGTGGWVTTRFTAEKPLPKKIWGRWLKESHALAAGRG